MKTWNSTVIYPIEAHFTSPDKIFCFCGITYEFFGTDYCIPERWPMGPFQLSLLPLAQTSSYATGSDWHIANAQLLYHKNRLFWFCEYVSYWKSFLCAVSCFKQYSQIINYFYENAHDNSAGYVPLQWNNSSAVSAKSTKIQFSLGYS